MGGLYFFFQRWRYERVSKQWNSTEVSRSHSTGEVFVIKTEGRAESLKRGSFFLEVVKVKQFETG